MSLSGWVVPKGTHQRGTVQSWPGILKPAPDGPLVAMLFDMCALKWRESDRKQSTKTIVLHCSYEVARRGVV